ncbi:hypothetical protein JL722_5787 [Aureococcus anophagefferens]|nr:hypothetical protein JL722_5787 [Aureococcus anophagefferens]
MPTGGSYEGDFAAGKSHGFGILEYHTGAIYRGAFVEAGARATVLRLRGRRDLRRRVRRRPIFGYGAITKKDADGAVELYEGEAAVNAAMGIGRFRFRDGATYEGEVVAGKPRAVPHGDGRYYRADEFEFKGQRVPRRPTARAPRARGPRARAGVRELEGEFSGLALVDDDEEAGEAAAKADDRGPRRGQRAARKGATRAPRTSPRSPRPRPRRSRP